MEIEERSDTENNQSQKSDLGVRNRKRREFPGQVFSGVGEAPTSVELESLRHYEARARALRFKVVLDEEQLANFHGNILPG